MQEYYFTLRIPYQHCERFYVPGTNSVIITADSGQRVQLPTKNLRQWVDRNGLNGRFRLIINDEKKITSFEKVC